MIHDPQIEVTCDGIGCDLCVFITPDFLYGGICHTSGSYATEDDLIEKKLPAEGWTVRDGKHFCEECSGKETP